MGPFFLNFYCKKLIDNPYFTKCNLKDKKWNDIVGNKLVIDLESMEFHFLINKNKDSLMLE